MVMHKVEDFDKWKTAYDENGETRKKEGSKGAFAFRNDKDPNQMVVISQWDDMKSAKHFAESEDLRKTMQKAGVTGKPEIYYLDEIERTPY